MMAFDWDNDPDRSKERAISERLTKLAIENPKAVASVKSGGSGVADYWANVTSPDPKIQGDLHGYLYKGHSGKPGGLYAEIHKAVQDGANVPWYGNWSGQTTPTQAMVDSRSDTIFQSVKRAIVAKEMKTPDEIREFIKKDTDYQKMLQDSMLGKWRGLQTSGAQEKQTYSPADIR